MKTISIALLCILLSISGSLKAQFENVLVNDDFTNPGFYDNTLLTLWGGNGSPTSGWEQADITRTGLTFRGSALTTSAMANSAFNSPTGLKTLNSFDYFFQPINRNNTTIKVEFDAVWASLNGGGENGRIVVTLMKDMPAAGAQFGQVDNVALDNPFGIPIYNIRIRNTSTVNGPLMLYGAGESRDPGWEPYNPGPWWLPGFSTQPCIGGVGCSPGTTGSYPNSPTRTSNLQTASATIWRHFTWIIQPERMELYFRNSSGGANQLVFFMQIPKYNFPENPTNAINQINAAHGTSISSLPTLYEWYNNPNAIRFFINGGVKAHIANVKVTREDATPNTWTGAQNTLWNNPFNWSNGAVPSVGAVAVVANTVNKPAISSQAFCGNLTLQPGSELRLQGSSALLAVNGTISGGGVMAATSGASLFLNHNAQTTLAGNHQLENLRVNVNDTVSVSGNINIRGELKLEQGVFDATAANIALKASGAQTATLAEVETGASYLGNISWERRVPNLAGWYFGATPLINTTLQELSSSFRIDGSYPGATTGGRTSLFFYSPVVNTNNGWVSPTNISNALVSGQGYRSFFNSQFINGGGTIRLTGPPRVGLLNVPLDFCATGCAEWGSNGGVNNGWNLVGNPYAANIDWHLLGKTNVNPSYHLWNKTVYGAYNQNTQLGINGVGRYIANGQGFFVYANGGGSNLQFTELAKSTGQPAPFLRETTKPDYAIRFRLSNLEGASDELALRWMPEASAGFDPELDTRKIFGATHQLYIRLPEQSLCLAAQPFDFNKTDSVDLMYTGAGGTLNLSWEALGDFEHATLKVKMLSDGKTFAYYEVQNMPLENLPSQTEKAVARLYFNATDPVSINNRLSKSGVLVHPNPSQGNIIVSVGALHEAEPCFWHLMDARGKEVSKGKVAHVEAGKMHLNLGVKTGFYQLFIENGGKTFMQKVAIE